MAVRNAFGSLALEHANQFGDAHLVSGNKIKWRREMNDPIATWWDKSENGITIPDPTNGSLVIAMGTTANAESWIVSKEIFTFPMRASVNIMLSQKIANNEVYFEMVGCDANGALDETRVAAWRIAGSDSTTTTIARSEVRNGQSARVQSGNLTIASITATTAILEITCEADEVWFSSKTANATSARSVAAVYNLVAPDPSGRYKLRIRVKNGTTAPASNTNVTVGFALGLDYTEQQVEVTGGNGNNAAGQTIPVTQIGTVTTTTNLTASATSTATTSAKVISAATTNATSVKTSAARLFSYQLANTSASWRHLKFYNKASAPTVGTDVPVFTVAIPPGGRAHLDMVFPDSFATGLAYAITGGFADNDTTAIGAGDVIGSLSYI